MSEFIHTYIWIHISSSPCSQPNRSDCDFLRGLWQDLHLTEFEQPGSMTRWRPCSRLTIPPSRRHCLARHRHLFQHLADLRAQQHVPQHFQVWRCASPWVIGSLFAPQDALISFTSYGADERTQESKPNRTRKILVEIFSIVAWLVSTLVPKHISRFRVYRRTLCWSRWSINVYETFGWRKSQFPCAMLFLRLAQKQYPKNVP